MESLFLRVLNMSLTASYVIAATLLVRLALSAAPKKWSYFLWSAAAFRLCCPVSLQSAISLLQLLPARPASAPVSGAASALDYIPNTIGLMERPELNAGIPGLSRVINSSLPAAAPMNSANPMQIWIMVGTVLWCAGLTVILLYSIISYLRLRRSMRTAILLEGNVYMSDAIRSPFILGLLRPNIYIPFGLEGDELCYVLSHERYHIRRRDHIVKAVSFLILSVHWFNPLCWLAFHLMGRDMEMSCDEKILEQGGNIRKPYSATLLSFAAGRRLPSPSPLAFGETGVKRRIKNALGWKKPRTWVTLCAAALCVTAVAACAVNPVAQPEDSAPGTPVSAPSTPNTMRPAVMYAGRLYYSTGKTTAAVPVENAYLGTVKSTVDGTQLPTRDGEANFDCLGTSFAEINDGVDQAILVLIRDEWVLFQAEASDELADSSVRTPFTGIMGYNGFFDLETVMDGHFKLCFYYAQTESSVLPIGESFGFGREDYIVDLDGDGVTELICNCTYGADGGRTAYVFRNRGGAVERGWLDWDMPADFDNWGANASWEEYDPDRGLFLVHYCAEGGGVKTLEFRGLDSFTFEPYQPSEEALRHLAQTGGESASGADIVWHADLNGDGHMEQILLNVSELNDLALVTIPWIAAVDGTKLCELGEMALSHPGWNTYALTELDGRTYLLQYLPVMYQGMATYQYTLWYLADGELLAAEQGAVDFSAGMPYAPPDNDVDALIAFTERVNELWAHSRLLVTCDENVLSGLYRADDGSAVPGSSAVQARYLVRHEDQPALRYRETMDWADELLLEQGRVTETGYPLRPEDGLRPKLEEVNRVFAQRRAEVLATQLAGQDSNENVINIQHYDAQGNPYFYVTVDNYVGEDGSVGRLEVAVRDDRVVYSQELPPDAISPDIVRTHPITREIQK